MQFHVCRLTFNDTVYCIYMYLHYTILQAGLYYTSVRFDYTYPVGKLYILYAECTVFQHPSSHKDIVLIIKFIDVREYI